MFLVKVFTKPLQGLRGRGAEPHIGKKVVGKAFFSKERFVLKENFYHENLCNLVFHNFYEKFSNSLLILLLG